MTEHGRLDLDADELERAGFDADAGAVFAWRGVTPYLTRDAIRATLAYGAGATRAAGGVVFDFALAPEMLGELGRRVHASIARRVEAVGEPFLSSFVPDELVLELHALDLARRADALRVGRIAHWMWAGAEPHGV